jgi:hypothetical protein
LVTSVTIISCKKEKEQTSTNIDMSINPSENMDAYLLSLKEKLQSAQKNGEFISLEQAQRDLGNLLNFDFGDANYATNVYHVDTIHVKLALTQGQVDLSQLAITYKEAFNSILETYHSIDLPQKSISSISCTFNELKTKEEGSEDAEIVVVTRGLNGDPVPASNHDTLDWRPKNYAGTCDGQYVGLYGAPEIIKMWLYQGQGTPNCSGERMYLTNVDHWDTFGYQHYDSSTGQFLIYTSFEPNQDSACISHEMMEYYYNNISSIFYQQPFVGHYMDYIVINCYHMHGTIPALNQYLWYYCWYVKIRHGKVNCTEVPAVD